jgi:hypothetical protein
MGIESTFRHRMTNPPSRTSGYANAHLQGGSVPFRWTAFLLGLAFPGLGHWSIGEKGRAVRILAGFLLLWFGGLLIGGPMSVAFRSPAYSTATQKEERRLWFLPQAGAGPIAFATAALGERLVPTDENSLVPHADGRGISRYTPVGHAADFGTLFCALAGLMNIAVALDAGRRPEPERRRPGR